jgi:hypothetical protein
MFWVSLTAIFLLLYVAFIRVAGHPVGNQDGELLVLFIYLTVGTGLFVLFSRIGQNDNYE